MILDYLIIGLYTVALILIFLYALATVNLLVNYLRSSGYDKPEHIDRGSLPAVTIQLPLFNELYVTERLLRNIALLDYPRQLLEIQVLDDSTDESLEMTSHLVAELARTGLDIKHITRKDRSGFKAGALKEGLKTASGNLIAIFDADFMPTSDWLLRTVPHFDSAEIGVVQTRWGHINRDYSLLTRVQAFALDAHFTLEQKGRNAKDHFINFNGTAGIWRRETIEDAGNWQGDTLTEDLDLSYRAQLRGWKFKYLEDVVTPAELPVMVSAARSQQFRWNKGGAENFRKSILSVFRSSSVSLKSKFHALLHLLNSTMFLAVLVVALLSIPMLYIKHEHISLKLYFTLLSFFVLSTLLFFISYWFMHKRTYGGGLKSFLSYTLMFFAFFAVAMGFSLHNSIAVLEGHLGKKSAFIRTPKFNIGAKNVTVSSNKYLKRSISPNVVIEGLLVLYFGFGIYSAFTVGEEGDFGLFPFHLMLFVGFGYVFLRSIIERA